MSFDIDAWMKEYLEKLRDLFGERLWFVGLQGSFGRGQAVQTSDIDAVVILDKASGEDLRAYGAMLDTMPNRDRACGFISGKDELLAWEKSDLFQFCYDTKPLIGSLDELKSRISQADIQRAVKIGACSAYHMCAHNMAHERDTATLKALYKSAVFTLQSIAYIQTGIYEKDRELLKGLLSERDQAVLKAAVKIKSCGELSSRDFGEQSSLLLDWASYWICHS